MKMGMDNATMSLIDQFQLFFNIFFLYFTVRIQSGGVHNSIYINVSSSSHQKVHCIDYFYDIKWYEVINCQIVTIYQHTKLNTHAFHHFNKDH